MLNNKPLDISKIKGISEVITLDSKFLIEQWDKMGSDYDKPRIDLRDIKLSDEFKKLPKKDLREDAKKENKIWGYIFYIREEIYIQRYMNYASNGVDKGINIIYSNVYSTKEAAQAALDHLLFEMNEIYNKLVKVEI